MPAKLFETDRAGIVRLLLGVSQMIIALSILAGVLGAYTSYRVLFYDSNDFWDGWSKLGVDRDRWIWQRGEPPTPPEHFEDEGWSSGIRVFVFIAVSIGCGWLVYSGLHKLFS